MLSDVLTNAFQDDICILQEYIGLDRYYYVRLELRIAERRLMAGSQEKLLDATVGKLDRLKANFETQLYYNNRPRSKLGAGTTGYKRRNGYVVR